jgi:3-hydroxyisobutyrate dehydrogenase-like beta-hydroxyacid dehydrogenase
MNEPQPSVAMIGLGSMGSALAAAVLAADFNVTVWNRSPDKSEALAAKGAAVAQSVGEAVSQADVVAICVRGYETANTLMCHADVAPLLNGKTVVQLGNGVPAEVTDAQQWFTQQGASYLDASIMTFPDVVGTDDCQVLVSGDPAAYQRYQSLFTALGGDIRFLGADAAASAVINSSGLAFVYLAAHAFVSAAAMCDAVDAPIDLLGDVVAKFTAQMPAMFGEYVSMIESGNYDSTSLRLASGAENLRAIAEFGAQAGVNSDLIVTALATFDAAADADHGTNLAAIFETLRATAV